MDKNQREQLCNRAKARNYTPPPYKFNAWLQEKREHVYLLMLPEKTALVNIDIQNFFSKPGAECFIPGTPEIIPCINKLVRYFRGHDMPIIWVQEMNRANGSDAGMMGKYFPHLLPPESIMSEGSHWFQLDAALDTKPTDIYVRKPKYDAFWGSDLEAILRALEAESLIFTGVDTTMCVHETLVGAFHRDFNCILAMDATAGSRDFNFMEPVDATAGSSGLGGRWFKFVEYLAARVLTTDEIIAELEALAPAKV